MGVRDRLRAPTKPPTPLPVDLVSRDMIRRGDLEFYTPAPVPKEREPVSIIITAYQTQDFIEECLDSIENQTYFKGNDDFEVLLGIDACHDTLTRVKEIKDNYRNLSVYMMDKNMGTYVTSNTLLSLVRFENIIRFDSDDIMKAEMVNEIMHHRNDYDVVRFGYHEFTKNVKSHITKQMWYPHGVVFFRKNVFDLAGGYRNWKCAADSELLKRVEKRVQILRLNRRLFFRRIHKQSLTKSSTTGFRTKVRNSYASRIREYEIDEKIKIRKRTNTYTKI